MISCNQKTLVLLVGLVLAFSFSADASQVRQQQDLDAQHDDPIDGDGTSNTNDQEDDDKDGADDQSSSSSTAKEPTYEIKSPKEEDGEKEQDKTAPAKEKAALKKVRLELAGNLREQSELKLRIAHLTNESQSDEEIEASALLVANQTESAEMAGMLARMWKEMRMFEVPSYAKHVKTELHNLKQDEQALEAELKGEPAKLKEGEKEEDEDEKEDEKEEDKEKDDKAMLKSDKAATPSTWNVWKMNRKQQNSLFMSSLVYLLGGLLAAVLFKQVRARYFEPELRQDAYPNPKDFSFHIFGCLGDMKLCVLGFCCPCLAWANTLDRNGILSYWKAFISFFALLLLHAYTMGFSSILVVALGVYYRQKLRETYAIESTKTTVAIDALIWCFCQPCAIVQEAREEAVSKRTGTEGP